MYSIRKGMKEDCVAIAGLIREFAESFYGSSNEANLGPEQLEADGFGCEPQFHTFVAEVNESKRIVGYVLYSKLYSSLRGEAVWMDNLYVQPQYTRLGIGTALFKAVVKHAVQLSCVGMSWICNRYDINALAFYERVGVIDLEPLEKYSEFKLNSEQIKKISDCDQ